jgi:FlaA1/EpsC-like NDP-sugar epimerase
LQVLTVPALADLVSGRHTVNELRPVVIEDLLGREPSVPLPGLLEVAMANKVVLVTGAGGSIGSELCRQALALGVKRLLLLERNEFGLYAIHQELSKAAGSEKLLPVLGDAADAQRLEALCRREGVQVLLHAAAYKHVPLVEANVAVAVANNVASTRAALAAARACGMERFLLISTDKAVRPTNAMGASKRVCELLVQQAAAEIGNGPGPICSMVRFGNVLGSSGSVVPLFRQQIAAGGPVTVTHPEITRYFMTIPEAVQLVLQAAGLARGGEVFVLDMGEPVRIADLARQMVLLSGCSIRDQDSPGGEIAITYTGLRPGEKLYEELLISASDQATSHPLIRSAQEESLPPQMLHRLLNQLDQAVATNDEAEIRGLLRQLVVGYAPTP